MNKLILNSSEIFYKNLLRKIFFSFDSEQIHEFMLSTGNIFGNIGIIEGVTENLFKRNYPNLKQKLHGINFNSPIGMAAGFDYKAKLYNILPALGFGFQTIGTITNNPYVGNSKPRLGRLIKSKSLFVNKGFKNEGIDKILEKIQYKKFKIPIGISIGKTNGMIKMSQEEAVNDIREAFEKIENSINHFSYYELNISCPNLIGSVEFYSTKNLEKLLLGVSNLKLRRPVFIKMPIEKDNKDVLKMLSVIEKHKFVKGVIFGNLQKDRNNKEILKEDLEKFKDKKGNFSGLPTQKRSDELINLAYKKYKSKLTIIGCGGVFSGQDAIRKILNGASLVQLITGLVFEGPQLVSKINFEISKYLEKNKLKNISELVGLGA